MATPQRPVSVPGTSIDLWEAVIAGVAAIFSFIILFTYIQVGDFGIATTLDVVIKWTVGVIIMTFGAILAGGLSDRFKKRFGLAGKEEIYEIIVTAATLLATVIIWFRWLGENYFELLDLHDDTGVLLNYGIISVAISWIVLVVLFNFVAPLITYLVLRFKARLAA